MAVELRALCIAATDPPAAARFWAGMLGWRELSPDPSGAVVLEPADDTGFDLRFLSATAPRTGRDRRHVDLTSRSPVDQQEMVARALALGGRHRDVGQRPDEEHVVLADPEANPFCIIEPGNAFLAECGLLGALACDGSQKVGYFWSRALAWPLVWDRDQETAIRSPHGGPKITWGGPPVPPKPGENRLHLHLAPVPGGSAEDEADRLVALGAVRRPERPRDGGAVALLDPDENEFCILPG